MSARCLNVLSIIDWECVWILLCIMASIVVVSVGVKVLYYLYITISYKLQIQDPLNITLAVSWIQYLYGLYHCIWVSYSLHSSMVLHEVLRYICTSLCVKRLDICYHSTRILWMARAIKMSVYSNRPSCVTMKSLRSFLPPKIVCLRLAKQWDVVVFLTNISPKPLIL